MKFIFIIVIFFSPISLAQLSADSILQAVRDRNDGYSYSSEVTLRLIDSKKNIRERRFYMLQKDMDKIEERTLMTFNSPTDVRGISFLIVSYDEKLNKADDQWMYFPAFRKVRRLGSNDKRGSFMGSVFNYYDLDKVRVADYKNTLLGDDFIDGRPVWHIERSPIDQSIINKSGYYKIHIWVDKERYITLRQYYFNAKGIVFKKQQSFDVENVQGVWTITRSLAIDIEKNKQSEISFANTVYNIDVNAKKFTKRNLRRGIRSSDLSDYQG